MNAEVTTIWGRARIASKTAAVTSCARTSRHKLAVALLLLLWIPCAFALDRGLMLAQLNHDRWTATEGAPAPIYAIAQTADGYLWLGTGNGLFRFDGVRFERIGAVAGAPLLHTTVTSLIADTAGALWVGYGDGGVSVIRAAGVTHYDDRAGLTPGTILGFALDKTGRVWATSRRGVSVFALGRWNAVDATSGFEPDWRPHNRPFIDRRGDVWIDFLLPSGAFGIAHLTDGASQFVTVQNPVESPYFAETPDGRVWAGDYFGLRPLASAHLDNRRPNSSESWVKPGFQVAGLLADRDGALWLSTQHGVARVPYPELLAAPEPGRRDVQPETIGPQEGLTSDVVWTLFEDREGSVWAGTSNGLDRFRGSEIASVRLPRRALPFAMAPAENGAMWVANGSGVLMRVNAKALVDNDTDLTRIEDFDFISGDATSDVDAVSCLYRAPDGTLWVGGILGGLWRGRGSIFEAVPWGGDPSDRGRISAFATDADGGLWISVAARALYHVSQGKWTNQSKELGMQRATMPRAVITEGNGAVWSEWQDGLHVFRSGEWTLIPAVEVDAGRVSSLQFRGSELWIGGERGVSIRRGDRFMRLHGIAGEEFDGTSGIVATASGDVWLNGRAGVTHIQAQELASAAASPTYHVKFARFDGRDNFLGATERVGPLPTAAMGSDGRLWFATNQAIYWTDPAKPARPSVATLPAIVNGVSSRDRLYPATDGLNLPAGTRDVRIDYTGLSLTIPQRVGFHYRLEGVDEDWQEAIDRRQAFYTNMGPGSYKFLVNATNELGVWAASDTSLTFSIAPWFWQTRTFLAVCALAGAALLWGLFALRLNILRRRIGRIYDARVAERERIARELHDTLLQSTQGLIFRVQAATNDVSPDDPARMKLERALELADEIMAEGRDRIQDLRVAEDANSDLPSALAAVGDELAKGHAAAFRVVDEGSAQAMNPNVRDEAYHIGREALLNAFRHAQAKSIEVQIIYAEEELRMRIHDDGVGIDTSADEEGSRPGHWGLKGMRERAQKIGAQLDVLSRPGTGTEIELRVPAATAFRQRTMVSRWLLIRMLAKARR